MNIKPYLPLVLALLVLAAAGGLYGFANYALITGQQQAAALGKTLEEKTQELGRIASARTALTALAADESALAEHFVGEEGIVPFLESLQATGRSLGATVEVLSVTNEKDAAHPRVTVALSVSGSFDAVMRTVGAIEYGSYDGVITRLALDTGGEKGGWTAAVTYSVALNPTH